MIRCMLGLIVVLTCAVVPATELLRSGRSNCSCGATKTAIHRYNVFHV